jgi:hypothetical protein
MIFDENIKTATSTVQSDAVHNNDEGKAYDLDISFWNLNPKEHLWSKLKAI